MLRVLVLLGVVLLLACGDDDGGGGTSGTGVSGTGGSSGAGATGGSSGSGGSGGSGGNAGSAGEGGTGGMIDDAGADADLEDASMDAALEDAGMDAAVIDASLDDASIDAAMDADMNVTMDAAMDVTSPDAGGAGTGGGDDDDAGGAGTGGGCATPIPNDAECPELADGWFGIRTAVDVWWPGTPTRDPGRGRITLHQLARLDSPCSEEPAGVVVSKVCGLELPVMTSDIACDAFQLTFPNDIWEASSMPSFTTTWNTTAFDPGAVLAFGALTRLLGIDLLNGQEGGAWPGSNTTGTFACEAGVGAACFPDHDDDLSAGITGQVRIDAAMYSYNDVDGSGIEHANSDTNYGRCVGGLPYRYRGLPTGIDLAAGGGSGGGVRAASVQLGLRAGDTSAAIVGNDCDSSMGAALISAIDLRALDCTVDPTTLNPFGVQGPDPRIADMSDACSVSEAQFVDSNVPAYQALAVGAVPGTSNRSAGWAIAGRDIDRRPSAGTRVAMQRLANLGDAEPSCADVRAAAYPAL